MIFKGYFTARNLRLVDNVPLAEVNAAGVETGVFVAVWEHGPAITSLGFSLAMGTGGAGSSAWLRAMAAQIVVIAYFVH